MNVPKNKVALVTGAQSGLGAAIVPHLMMAGYFVISYDLSLGLDVCHPSLIPDNLDVLVNCAGINRIAWLKDVKEEDWDDIMHTNVKGMFLMTQACESALRRSAGTVLNIVSNAAHVPMRCSAAYNASKGAALILTRQLARELAPDITVFSVSPNKMKGTAMSEDIDRQVMLTRGWSAEQAAQYQKSGLLCGEETPVEAVAEFIGWLLQDKEHHKYLAGCDLPYGA
jgi:NAD(P)-dependent dehydrogenase (short-subunit alcohol dehydrogenase family)